MTAISTGGDPFRRAGIDAAQDQDQIEGFSGFPNSGTTNIFGTTPWSEIYPFGGGPDTEGLSTEEVLRQQEATEE